MNNHQTEVTTVTTSIKMIDENNNDETHRRRSSTSQQRPEDRPPPRDLSMVPCKNFLKGRCHAALKGEKCPFLHCAPNEVPLCKSMLLGGACARGERCSYSHDQNELRARWAEMEGGGGGGRGGGGRRRQPG